MKSRKVIIFLLSVISYHVGMSAGSDKHILSIAREKVKRVYRCTCEETRTAYEAIKRHKKLIAGIVGMVSYFAFEGFGCSQDWDTPLRRLFTPKKLLDDALRDYHALQLRYEALEKQLQNKELEDLKKQQQLLMEQLEKYMEC